MQIPALRTAWLLLVAALALHVIDEAATGFLDVYNPTVRALRAWLGWFPMPTFEFGEWLGGLVAAVILLAFATPLVERSRVARRLGLVFAGLMFLNGIGHITGTVAGQTVNVVRFPRPMPGFWSSPFLIAAAVLYITRVAAEPPTPVTAPGPSSK